MPRGATDAIVEAIGSVAPELPGVIGDAATAAAFAGTWAAHLHTPAHPGEGQRLYRLGTLVAAARHSRVVASRIGRRPRHTRALDECLQ